MSIDGYMTSPEWATLEPVEVLGRPVAVWRRRPRSVTELMALGVRRDEDDFLVQGERRFTHGAFRRAVAAGAGALAAAGVQPGDRVLIVLYNAPEFWLVQCAAWALGAVPVLGNRWWSPHALARAIARIGPALVATDLPVEAPAARLTPDGIAGWWRLPAPARPLPVPAVDEDDVAVIVFTAGSTGEPKSVQLSHRALVWSQQTAHVLRGGRPLLPPAAGAQKVALATTPLFHNGGMVATLGNQLDGGRIVFLSGRFDPAEALRLIEAERVTSWSAVPTMFQRLLRHPDRPARDLSSLIAPASGGAAVSAEFVAEVTAALPHAARGFSSGYGMTEMSFVTLVGASDLAARPGTVGRVLPGVELRIEAPPGGEGELLARSAALMIGYLDGPERPIDADGWYATGDIGRMDADGFVFITGRAKDMVIRGGENISCQHVEDALLAHADVLEAAVIGVPDAEFGEAVAAVLHPRPGTTPDPAAIAAGLRARLAYFEVPTRWLLRAAPLPVLPTGKIDKPALRREFSDHVNAREAEER
ncbi:class I adenylate-forming enzyme family protein [Sphingomonas profundi]|uniref:class I adenylate-forming enzyme family protein n=1 Tax=Alterirhizorhabdus profundi TaxID=2681549 RepID=UPI0012E728B3|nr:class I adenylate-forming enzyme family protein [Sphingomonas profundi]